MVATTTYNTFGAAFVGLIASTLCVENIPSTVGRRFGVLIDGLPFSAAYLVFSRCSVTFTTDATLRTDDFTRYWCELLDYLVKGFFSPHYPFP